MTTYPASAVIQITRTPSSGRDDKITAVIERAKVHQSGRVVYTLELEAGKHWRVLSAGELERRLVEIISTPDAMATAA